MAEQNHNESEYLFGKSYTCPACGKEFKGRTVKTGKARVNGTDDDLRPRYETVDALKYDAILCPYCGYAALSRFFNTLTQVQKGLIKEKVSAAYKPREENEVFSYADALERHKLALLSSMVKGAKDSEIGYTCLKIAWVLRGERETLVKEGQEEEKRQQEISAQEEEFLKKAKEELLKARQTEDFPVCGMDEATVDYLVSVLCVRFGEIDMASRMISGILSSHSASARVKDRARDVKAEISRLMKEAKSNE